MSETKQRWCRHYSSYGIERSCALGHDIDEITGGDAFGRGLRIPCCDGPRMQDQSTCPDRDLETWEEVAEQEAESARFVADFERRLRVTAPLIERIKQTGGSGSEPCPACDGGTVRWSVDELNRHVRMCCSTDGCLNFME